MLPATLLVVSLGSAIICWLQRALQSPASAGDCLLFLAGSGAVGALALFLLTRTPLWQRLERTPGFRSPTAKSYALALQAGLLLLLVPAFLAVWQTPYHRQRWIRYE